MRQTRPRPELGIAGLALAIACLCAVRAQAQLPATLDLSVAPGSEPSRVYRVLGASAGDRLGTGIGSALAYGDLNGDGYDDLIAGAGLSAGLNGQVYVIFGHAAPASTLDLSIPPPGGALASFLGAAGDHAGSAVASGDFNGDGFDDLAIGAPYHAGPAGAGCGAVYIVYGAQDFAARSADLGTTVGLANVTQIFGEDAGELAGRALAVGDVNGDGFDDLIIGAPQANPLGRVRAGSVYIIYGSAGLVGQTIDLNTTGTTTHGETRLIGELAFDNAGFSVAAGDVNGDGIDDVVVGAPGIDAQGRSNGGAHVYYGSTGSGSNVVELTQVPVTTTFFPGFAGGDQLGFAVACGDVNGDGFADVALGSPGTRAGRLLHSGTTYLFYGSASLPGQSPAPSSPPGAGQAAIEGRHINSQSGSALALSDLNGDGLADLMIGAWRAPYEQGRDGAGEGYLFYGQTLPAGAQFKLLNADPGLRALGAGAQDLFGSATAGGGDFDGDGFADLSIAASMGENPSLGPENDAGYVATLFGDGFTTQVSARGAVHNAPGASPSRGVGGRLSPVLRAYIGYSAGAGPVSDASTTTVTITRSKADLSNIGKPDKSNIANVYWHVQTDRTSFGMATVTFQYTDAEIAGLFESGLWLVQAASPTGFWSTVPLQQRFPERNEFRATVPSAAYFAILDITTPTPTPSPTPSISPTATPTTTPTPSPSFSPTVSLTPSLTPIPGNHASFMGDTVPAKVYAGETLVVGVTMLNTGSTTWNAPDNYKLALISDSCSAWGFMYPRVNIFDPAQATPGQAMEFNFPINAPSQLGPCTLQVQMIQEFIEFFGPVVQLEFEVVERPNAARDWQSYE